MSKRKSKSTQVTLVNTGGTKSVSGLRGITFEQDGTTLPINTTWYRHERRTVSSDDVCAILAVYGDDVKEMTEPKKAEKQPTKTVEATDDE